jgi:ubiquinol-cytochrome c reductase cytochrome c subunit
MRLWFGVLGAPIAWAVQHVAGYAFTVARCGEGGGTISLDGWTIGVTAVAVLVAVGAEAAAIVTFRATSDGREHFLSVIGVTIGPLFVAMMLMSGLGVVALTPCAQAATQPPIVAPANAGGRELFAANCARCHGTRGEGVTAPSLQETSPRTVDFYLRTGYMPLANPGDQPERRGPQFPQRELRALADYVDSISSGTAPIPRPHPERGRLSDGLRLFTEHCAGCHQVVAGGGVVTGARVPPLAGIPAVEIAEAVRTGPYVMPTFSEKDISDAELDSIIAYVRYTDNPDDPGGWGIGHLGPFPEGMITWLLAAIVLVATCVLIGERMRS